MCVCVWEREAGTAHPASGESANYNICCGTKVHGGGWQQLVGFCARKVIKSYSLLMSKVCEGILPARVSSQVSSGTRGKFTSDGESSITLPNSCSIVTYGSFWVMFGLCVFVAPLCY